jgi:hypothetical protein
LEVGLKSLRRSYRKLDWSLFDITRVEAMRRKPAELPNLDIAIYRAYDLSQYSG